MASFLFLELHMNTHCRISGKRPAFLFVCLFICSEGLGDIEGKKFKRFFLAL